MNRLTAALVASALAFGYAWALADNSDGKPPEEDVAPKSQPAPAKDWPTRREQREATAAAARERAEGAPKERPLIGDFGPPDARAADQSKVRPTQPKEQPMIEPRRTL
jgi:hypothetical protein